MAPNVYIIAGSNGAGKTTFAKRFLPHYAGCAHFINADLIAQGLSPFDPDRASARAGRLVLELIREIAGQKRNFAFETTLSGRTYASMIRRLKVVGYGIHMFYLWIPSVELALDRIKKRVQNGGHSVPEAVVRRRYQKSLRNLFSLYVPLVDYLEILDNSSQVPRTVFCKEGEEVTVVDEVVFSVIRAGAAKPSVAMEERRRAKPMKIKEERYQWPPATDAERALREAVAEVIEEYRRTGTPLVVWRDGKVVEIDPNEAADPLGSSLNHGGTEPRRKRRAEVVKI